MLSGRIDNISLDVEPWDEYTDEAYRADIAECKIEVTIETVMQRSAVYVRLRYQKKYKGRSLNANVVAGGVRLFVGDRLEPSPQLMDVSRFQSMQPPFRVVFWRMASTQRVVHESPLMLVEGLSMMSHGIDILHCWHLGPLLRLTPLVLKLVINSKILSPDIPGLYADDSKRVGLLRVKAELWRFYKLKRNEDPDWQRKSSELWNLTENMYNGKSGEFKAKAAESKGMMFFCEWLLNEHMDKLQRKGGDFHLLARFLLASCAAAVKFENLLDSYDRYIPREGRLELWKTYMQFLSLYQRSGGAFVGKHHQMMHLLHRIYRRGNPRHYGTYKDESLNGVIAKIARSCHRSSFGLSVHMKFNILQQIVGISAVELHP